jgi:methylmalonyl-CoA/ethylmalonyl-CoA epimerase
MSARPAPAATGPTAGRVVFDHIALGAPRLDDALDFLVGTLGGRPVSGGRGRGFRFACWGYDGDGRIEVIEPAGAADGFLHRFLAQRGPGIHHVTFKVPSLRAACDRAEARGYPVVGYDDTDPGWKTAFLHPRRALGIVVQLAESANGDGRPWAVPPGPPAPPPVTVLGLRLRARSAERARIRWSEILGAAAESGPDGTLVFRWPGSPMRLAVEVAPEADEGPVCIEVASDRPLALPAAPHPRLGAVFVQRPAPAVS